MLSEDNIINKNKFNKKNTKNDGQTTNALQNNNWSYQDCKRVSTDNVITKITINGLNSHLSSQNNLI